MKLLLDQNLSRRLVPSLEEFFPGSTHVSEVQLDCASDQQVWKYAKDQGFMIISKDTDFLQLAMLRGHPPKIVHLEIGNCSTADIHSLVVSAREDIYNFADDAVESFLILKPT